MRETRRIIRSSYNYLKHDFPDETLHKMCYSKTRYNKKELTLDKIAEINNNREVKLRSYPCPICKGFHLTSK